MCVCVCVAKPVAVELRCHATALIFFFGGGPNFFTKKVKIFIFSCMLVSHCTVITNLK